MESLSSINKQKVAKLPDEINIENINTSSIMYNNSKKYSLLSYGNTKRDSLNIESPVFDSFVDCEKYAEYIEYYFKIPKTSDGVKFLTLITDIEKRLIALAFENKTNWFDKNQENIKFRSLIKSLDDNEDENVIKFRMPYTIKTKRLHVDSIDNIDSSDSEAINITEITDGLIRLIINVNAIWFDKDTFGLYLRPVYVEEIKQCDYQFQERNASYFIDSEMPCASKHTTKNVIKCDVNKLNNMVSSIQNGLNDELNINLDSLKFASNKSSNRSSNKSKGKKLGRIRGVKLSKSLIESDNDLSESSESELELDLEE
jgi:hypothetical protein